MPFTETTDSTQTATASSTIGRPESDENAAGADQWALSMYAGYTILVPQASDRDYRHPRHGIHRRLGLRTSRAFSDNVRYRMTFSVQAQNLTNRDNFTGYSGVLTSPFFGRPTMVLNPRRVVLNVGFNF